MYSLPRTLGFLASISIVAIVPISAQDGPPTTHPTIEDLFTVKPVGGLSLSPDGEHILYTVTNRMLDSNKTDTDIWVVATSGDREPVQLTQNPGNDSRPSWRPDGSAFAFVSARGTGENRRPALYLMRAFGGEAEKLYTHATTIGAYAWSPDGTRILFAATDEEPKEAKENKKTGRDIEIEDEPGQYRHLWVIDIETREAKRITEGRAYTVNGFNWSPDGRYAAFSSAPTNLPPDSWKSDIYVIDVNADSAEAMRITSNPGPDGTPYWTPDGEWIVFTGRETDALRLGYNRLYRIRPNGEDRQDVSPQADVNPGIRAIAADGRGVFLQGATGTTTGLFYMPFDTRTVTRLSPEAGLYTGTSFSKDRDRVAYAYESPTAPAEIFVADLPSPRQPALADGDQLTTHNEHAAEWAVGRTEVIRWPSADGREIEGLVVLPAGWSEGNGPRALITKIHGGPSGVHRQNFRAASSRADAQRYAADGYAVFLPNPRGSSGYGDASQRLVLEDWGGRDFEDIMTGVDYLVERGIAHPDSLGVMGWSYGGYMTAWTVTQTARFKAAVAGAAITETISMWGTQDIVHVFEAYFGGGPYEAERWEVYQRSNPLAFVTNATTPTMVIHGKNDPRVPPNQARTFFRALRANGVQTKLVWLPRTGHGPSEPGLQYETARNQKEWLDQWIRRRPGVSASDDD